MSVTSKKAIYEELPLEELDTDNMYIAKIVKPMFEFFQVSGGLYFGKRTENRTAKGLKETAWRARGNKEEGKLATLEDYFEQHFRG